MKKKMVMILFLVVIIAGGVFAQEEHKHDPFDVLVGLNFGMGLTPNIGDVFSIGDEVPQGNYAFTFDFGLTADFYLTNWLSLNTGLLLHPDIYVLLDQDLNNTKDLSLTDIAATPLCLTIPVAAHINIPKVEWLYTGIGLNLNFPIKGMLDSAAGVDTKGKFFVGIPIDLGFDFIQPGSGGMRFFFRVTPEIHEHGTAVPIGFVWQIWNWKVTGNKNRKSETENGYETANTARTDAKAEKPEKQTETKQSAQQTETKSAAAAAPAKTDNAQYRAALDNYNAAKSKLEKAETARTEAEARLVSAQEAATLAEAEFAKAATALSALENR